MLARALLVSAALTGGIACTHAPERGAAVESADPAAERLVLLEELFWTCDYVATTRGMDATPMHRCAAATRELRQEKFDGSFQRLLEWWRENKGVEHGRRHAQREVF